MAIQFSVSVRNARLDAIETAIGASPIIRIRTGAQPATTATADAGTVLATVTPPADWLSAAANGSKALLGTWADSNGCDAAGTAAHFRIYDAAGTTCHLQGTVVASGAVGDMQLDNVVLAAGQAFSITGFTLTDANS